MTESMPTPESRDAAEKALQAIKNRTFSGRHPELGKMINCPYCGLRHRENDNGRNEPCEQKFAVINGVPAIAGQTPATKPEFLFDGDIPFKQARLAHGAHKVKGKRKTPRKKHPKPLSHWRQILIEKSEIEEKE